MGKKSSQELFAQFLLAEYNSIQNRISGFEEIKTSRVNFFLLIVAAAIAGLPSLFQNTILQKHGYAVLIIISFTLFLVGFSILVQLVDFSGTIVRLQRSTGKIRRWFLELDRESILYLPFEPADDKPRLKVWYRFLLWRGAEPVVIAVNALFLTLFIVAASLEFYSFPKFAIILISLAIFGLNWWMQLFYVRRKLSSAQKRISIRVQFPFDDKALQELYKRKIEEIDKKRNEG